MSFVWTQDHLVTTSDRFTRGDGRQCPCPHKGCEKINSRPAEGVEIRPNDTTLFSKPCQHCGKTIHFAVVREGSEDGTDRAYLTACDTLAKVLKPDAKRAKKKVQPPRRVRRVPFRMPRSGSRMVRAR